MYTTTTTTIRKLNMWYITIFSIVPCNSTLDNGYKINCNTVNTCIQNLHVTILQVNPSNTTFLKQAESSTCTQSLLCMSIRCFAGASYQHFLVKRPSIGLNPNSTQHSTQHSTQNENKHQIVNVHIKWNYHILSLSSQKESEDIQ